MNALIETLIAQIENLTQQAADLQAAGAIRPDNETKWGALRVTLDQLGVIAVNLAEVAASAAPENPDGAAFEKLRESVETLGVLVDTLADKLEA